MASFVFGKNLPLDFEAALAKLREVLAAHQFGIVSDIDVAGTLKAKIGVDIPRYRILGACSPKYAHRAITIHAQAGALLPCSVVVRERADGTTAIEFMDPVAVFRVAENPQLDAFAIDAKAHLQQVVDAL